VCWKTRRIGLIFQAQSLELPTTELVGPIDLVV